MTKLPGQYLSIKKRFKKYFSAVDNLGKSARTAGPLNKKTSHLVQIAAAAAILTKKPHILFKSQPLLQYVQRVPFILTRGGLLKRGLSPMKYIMP
jgi:hypothetical protein